MFLSPIVLARLLIKVLFTVLAATRLARTIPCCLLHATPHGRGSANILVPEIQSPKSMTSCCRFDSDQRAWMFGADQRGRGVGGHVQLVILRNVWKALVPGAPFVVLVNNPQSVGTRFSSIQMGDPETIYAPGQLVGVQMFRVYAATTRAFRLLPTQLDPPCIQSDCCAEMCIPGFASHGLGRG